MSKRTVSTVLNELLVRHRISAMALHRSTGVPQSTLSRILSGKIADPSDRHISRIAEYFRISTDRLRGRDDSHLLVPSEHLHPELHDICLWDDDTPVADDEVSIAFLRQVEPGRGALPLKRASVPGCVLASAACATMAWSLTRQSA